MFPLISIKTNSNLEKIAINLIINEDQTISTSEFIVEVSKIR